MTDITPLLRPDQKIIQSYAAGRLKISGEYFDTGIIVLPFSVQVWKNASVENLSPDDFADIAADIDVLLIGTGSRGALLLPQQRVAFKQAGISVEMMDTGAACRTFNVLTAEGRRVAAALIPVS